jgi:hypothetical protein
LSLSFVSSERLSLVVVTVVLLAVVVIVVVTVVDVTSVPVGVFVVVTVGPWTVVREVLPSLVVVDEVAAASAFAGASAVAADDEARDVLVTGPEVLVRRTVRVEVFRWVLAMRGS